MPNEASRLLTTRHRAQLQIVLRAVRRSVLELARAADMSDIDRWWRRVRGQALGRVALGFGASRSLAVRYVREHASLNGHNVDPTPAVWRPAVIETSLRVTGPVAFKEAVKARGVASVSQARAVMAERMAAAALRHAANGERETVTGAVEESEVIVGWRRVLDEDPCFFCAMLASRGAVYLTRATASFEAHDDDQCTPEPLYEHEEEPAFVQELQDYWARVTEGKSGRAAILAWRRAWDHPEAPGAVRPFDPDAKASREPIAGRPALELVQASGANARRRRGELRLTRGEHDALREYVGTTFQGINGALRRGASGGALGRVIDRIKAIHAESRLSDDAELWRGMQEASRLFGDRLSGDLTGFEYVDAGFGSYAANESVARQFTDGSFGDPVLLRAVVRRGTGAIRLSEWDDQSEILLQAGTRVRVVRDHGISPKGYRLLDVEVTPADG